MDGKTRGVTPLTLADLSAGHHEVVLKGDGGTVQRTVTIAANQTATIDEGIFSGFVTVYTPFDVTITEGGRVLRADDRHQIMLPAGIHELRIDESCARLRCRLGKVEIKPGETTNLQLTPEPSTITVTATSAAEVWLDGTRLGDTPLNARAGSARRARDRGQARVRRRAPLHGDDRRQAVHAERRVLNAFGLTATRRARTIGA